MFAIIRTRWQTGPLSPRAKCRSSAAPGSLRKKYTGIVHPPNMVRLPNYSTTSGDHRKSVLDVLMSEAQKTRFSDATYSFWNWIDDCKNVLRSRLSARSSFKQIISSFFFCSLFVIFGTLIAVSSNMIDIAVLSYVIWGFGFLIALVGLLPIYVLWYVVAV